MAPLLVCPGCRTRDDAGLHVRTLERQGDLLACECGRTYPVIDGVPVVFRDEASIPSAGPDEPDLSPEVGASLAGPGPDDAPYARLYEHLSIYLDAHWGDRAVPPPDGPAPAFAGAAIVERIAALPRVRTTLELGCSTGRILAELARSSDHVTGLDLSLGAVRRARRLLDGESLPYARRIAGRHYRTATATPGDRTVASERRTLICGDALDPPFVPFEYDRVVALNMLDAVPHPRQLLLVADNLCAPGGELVLASPFAWQTTVMDDQERIGGSDPAADLAAILQDGRDLGSRYEIREQAELPWTLRRDARSAVAYRTAYVRAVKRER